jgi:histidine triad (HIT) family protein
MPPPLSTGTDCVFCRVATGEAPAALVRIDERTLAFMAIAPATDGHVLVVPRRHARNLLDIDAGDLQAVSLAVQEIARWQRERLGCAGVSILQANEAAGFQTVFHYHVHVVPRYPGDRVRRAWSEIPPAEPADLERVAERLRGGPITTPTVLAQATHALGAATVIIDADGRVLLVRHNHGPLNWEIPGGLSEAGESAEETARREAREELGVEVAIEALTGVYWEPDWRGVGGHYFAFRARLIGHAAPSIADPKEIADIGWFVASELPRPMSDFTARRIADALGGGPPAVRTVGERRWRD